MANYLHKTRDPVDYRVSTSTAQIESYNAADWFKQPDVSAVAGVATKYWARPLTDPVTEMDQSSKDAVDAAEVAAVIAAAKQAAKDLYDQLDDLGRLQRSVVKLTVDELNALRTWTRDFKSEAAAATNLGDFQSRIATLATLNDRTYSQAKTAIETNVDGE